MSTSERTENTFVVEWGSALSITINLNASEEEIWAAIQLVKNIPDAEWHMKRLENYLASKDWGQ